MGFMDKKGKFRPYVDGNKIIAEDVGNPGHFFAIQGQYDSNGNFVLLTNGSGGPAPTSQGIGWMSIGSTFVVGGAPIHHGIGVMDIGSTFQIA